MVLIAVLHYSVFEDPGSPFISAKTGMHRSKSIIGSQYPVLEATGIYIYIYLTAESTSNQDNVGSGGLVDCIRAILNCNKS